MHHHHNAPRAVTRKLVIASIATMIFVVLELGAGVYASSLALIGDALHNFTDSLALLIALIAVRLERRPPTIEKSFGYQRAGILAAFVNSGTLVAFTIFIFIEAFQRIRVPHRVDSLWMIGTAALAIVLNTAITLSLLREGRHDMNIRSAVLHMFGDALSGAGIIVAAFLIRITGSTLWDPAASVLIGILILWSSWGIFREAANLLLEGTPAGIDPDEVSRALGAIDGISGVHHLHIWAIGPARPAMSCHLMVGDVPLRSTASMLASVNETLAHRYGIVHATVQFEFASCAEDDPFCLPYSETETPKIV
jgi:cobalt-zinc-cadmium efflux system protein